jgi:hypothetical protein
METETLDRLFLEWSQFTKARTAKEIALTEALEAAIECGMVPVSSAKEGGASAHSRQVQVADMIRTALAKARGE